MNSPFKKGVIIPDARRIWIYREDLMELLLLDSSGAPLFFINIIDRRILEHGSEGELPTLKDFRIDYRDSQTDTPASYVAERQKGVGCLVFLHCEPGLKIRFKRKSEPLIRIDMTSGEIVKYPKTFHDYLAVRSPSEIGIFLDQGGRIEYSYDFRNTNATRTVRFTVKELLTSL